MGVATSVASAHILELGPRKRNGSPGLGLIRLDLNPQNLREHLVSVTAPGRQLLVSLTRYMTSNNKGE